MEMRFGGVILSGGGGVRLGGADKGAIEAGGLTLLERAVDAFLDAEDIVVVGDDVPLERPVTFRREQPRGSGPAAAVIAGLTGFLHLPEYVGVLAVDMPYVSAATFRRLRAAATADGALLIDAEGRRQYLCGVYNTALLRAVGSTDLMGMSMKVLLRSLDLVEVAAIGREASDIDTWDDIRRLREMTDHRG